MKSLKRSHIVLNKKDFESLLREKSEKKISAETRLIFRLGSKESFVEFYKFENSKTKLILTVDSEYYLLLFFDNEVESAIYRELTFKFLFNLHSLIEKKQAEINFSINDLSKFKKEVFHSLIELKKDLNSLMKKIKYSIKLVVEVFHLINGFNRQIGRKIEKDCSLLEFEKDFFQSLIEQVSKKIFFEAVDEAKRSSRNKIIF